MAPQRLEKIESAPGNGMGSEASNLQDLVRHGAADRASLRPTNRESDEVVKLQVAKKAPNALKLLDAKLKSALRPAAGDRPSLRATAKQPRLSRGWRPLVWIGSPSLASGRDDQEGI
jgi:hypothetical protein